MSLKAHNSYSQRAKVNKRNGAELIQEGEPSDINITSQSIRGMNNICGRCGDWWLTVTMWTYVQWGISTPAMQCDRRAVRIVSKRGWGVEPHTGNALMIISLDTRGTVRVGDGGAVPA